MVAMSLLTLALEAFGKYVTNITEMLVIISHYTAVENFTENYLHPTCCLLEDMVQNHIPPPLANEVTRTLMLCLIKTYNDLDKRRYMLKLRSDEEGKLRNLSLETIAEVSAAILHPSITKFQFSRAHVVLFVGYFQIRRFVNMFLRKVLNKLKVIKILRLEVYQFDAQIVLEGLSTMKYLEELTFWGCSDDILEVLSDSCKNLKKLDVRNSTDVTDRSVEVIWRFKQLKYLDIINTSITSDGVSKIMSGEHDLKVLKVELLSDQVEVLPRSFPNLTLIHVRFLENCSLSGWKSFEYLKCLYLSHHPRISGSFIYYEELLRQVGKQLTHLKLIDMCNLNLRFVAENCPSLQYIGIHLMCPDCIGFYDNVQRYHLINYPSIETCDIEVFRSDTVEEILTSFVNVKKVNLRGFKEPFGSLLRYLLQRLAKDRIELYFFGNKLQISGDNLIVSKANGSSFITHILDLRSVVKDIICWKDVDYRDRAFKQI
ncbi:hypothetical protein L9F63_005992 [Diploptera punctata]|uniref:Uncharacterized protein n=1 Tax=Diploptera punctata TaxID=6984 RepID=A0AAD8E5C6_DIPPU|nr:hypothetical protein L9F63_005992 [Diploptera punctata]